MGTKEQIDQTLWSPVFFSTALRLLPLARKDSIFFVSEPLFTSYSGLFVLELSDSVSKETNSLGFISVQLVCYGLLTHRDFCQTSLACFTSPVGQTCYSSTRRTRNLFGTSAKTGVGFVR